MWFFKKGKYVFPEWFLESEIKWEIEISHNFPTPIKKFLEEKKNDSISEVGCPKKTRLGFGKIQDFIPILPHNHNSWQNKERAT